MSVIRLHTASDTAICFRIFWEKTHGLSISDKDMIDVLKTMAKADLFF